MKVRKKGSIGFMIAESEDDKDALHRLWKEKTIRGAFCLWDRTGEQGVFSVPEIDSLIAVFPNAVAVIQYNN